MKRRTRIVLLAGMLAAVLAVGPLQSASAQGWSFSIGSGPGYYGGGYHHHHHHGYRPPVFVPPPPPCHVQPYPSVYRYRAYYGPYGGGAVYGGYRGYYGGFGW